MWETICQFLLLVPLVVVFSIRYYYNFWQRRKIPCVASNCLDFDWCSIPAMEFYAKIYRQLDSHKFGGFYERFCAKLMVRDAELIKKILIDDFECFHNRGDVTFDDNEPLTRHMFGARGVTWKNLRTSFAPVFTCDKIEFMFESIGAYAKELGEVINDEIKIEDEIDLDDFNSRYTIDVLFSCIFGLKTRTIRCGDSVWKSMASKVSRPSFTSKLITFTRSAFPGMKKVFGLGILDKSANEFFSKIVQETIDNCENNDANVANDFLRMVIDARSRQEASEFVMTNELLAAQCFSFFVAGRDTIIMTLNGALYELAANPHVQDKLQDEIDAYLNEYDDKINNEIVENMPYLHQVFSETLRKYPAFAVLNRICAEDYSIPNTEMIIEKGTEVLIPVSGLHSDPQYFPNPELFDPSRFENLGEYLPCRDVYLPFGDGPRNCIGSRFASFGVKLALIYLLHEFRFELCPKTRYPFEFECMKIATSVKHEIFLRCCRR